ncbi:hypothetical protein SSX86_010967 [Deinandra increscens subsp. villosa]|uniref:DUF5110 domain-containing protein n=1 Tax=Deinandra increscens subsp. villosa TaxID=3103831 RepID=A0AAP0DCR7_9ASTR
MVSPENTNWIYEYGFIEDIPVPDANFSADTSRFSWQFQPTFNGSSSNPRSTYTGMKLGNPNKRPFILTRAGFIEDLLFEDDGDGYEYTNGGYLLTTYMAELKSSVITVRVSKAEGLWARPNRRLHVDAWGTGEEDV